MKKKISFHITATVFDHHEVSANFLKMRGKIILAVFLLNEDNSSAVGLRSGNDRKRRKAIPTWNGSEG